MLARASLMQQLNAMRTRQATLMQQTVMRNMFMRQQTRMNTALYVAAQRQVHSRGYNRFDDDYHFYFTETNFALMGAKNTPNIVFVLQKYEKHLTDEQIAYAFWQIAAYQLERTPEFWDIVVPMVKRQLATLDRQCTNSMGMMIEAAARMSLQDNEFWELVEQKLVDEGLLRYFTLEATADILCNVAHVGRGSDDLVEAIEKTFIKHRKGLSPQTIDVAKQGFSKLAKGSEIMHRVLADPNTELPALE